MGRLLPALLPLLVTMPVAPTAAPPTAIVDVRVAAGARADLLLLDGNPGEAIATLRSPAGVMVGGRWFLEPDAIRDSAAPGNGVTPRGVAPPARASADATASSR